jgi:predicted nuclease of predicted toxin-antitoxin system
VKVLLDTCVWGGAKKTLADAGHDVVWSGDWAEDPGDEAILARAHAESRILVTLDRDFGELAIFRGQPHSGIVRLVQVRAMDQGNMCRAAIEKYGDQLINGAIVTVELLRVRIRPPEGQQ